MACGRASVYSFRELAASTCQVVASVPCHSVQELAFVTPLELPPSTYVHGVVCVLAAASFLCHYVHEMAGESYNCTGIIALWKTVAKLEPC